MALDQIKIEGNAISKGCAGGRCNGAAAGAVAAPEGGAGADPAAVVSTEGTAVTAGAEKLSVVLVVAAKGASAEGVAATTAKGGWEQTKSQRHWKEEGAGCRQTETE